MKERERAKGKGLGFRLTSLYGLLPFCKETDR